MTNSSVTKRSRTATVLNFTDVDLGTLTMSAVNEPMINGDAPRINLTPSTPLMVRYGFNLSGDFEKPTFLSKDNEGKGNWLSIRIGLEKEQAEFLKAFDEKCRDEFLKNNPNAQWMPLTTLIEREQLWTMKVRVYFAGTTTTFLRVWEKDGAVLVPGWKEAEEFMAKYQCFRRADAKVVVKPQRVWKMNGKAGLILMATQLALKACDEPIEEDVFAETEW